MALRPCPVAGCPTLIPPGTRYCPTHTRDRERARGSRQQRGYGTAHDKLRAQWQARIDSGMPTTCACGCGTPIRPGDAWDLGHDHDNGGYLGPMTPAHNRADGGRRAHPRRA